jgi:COP9 signalosome complex subunit 3
MPGSISGASSRTLKALAKPYEVFATGFVSGETDTFQREIESTAEVFRLEGNVGLAVQCMDAFRRKQIIALRDTYVTLGVDEIAQKNFDVTGRGGDVGSREETERVILGMVSISVWYYYALWPNVFVDRKKRDKRIAFSIRARSIDVANYRTV